MDDKIIGLNTSLMVKRSTLSICYVKELFISLQISQKTSYLSQEKVSKYLLVALLVSTGEAYKFLRFLSTGKAPGPDGIPNQKSLLLS